eukprot:5460852-Prorocentrum_lima.AAC.1
MRPCATDPPARYATVAARIAAEEALPQHLQPAGDETEPEPDVADGSRSLQLLQYTTAPGLSLIHI